MPTQYYVNQKVKYTVRAGPDFGSVVVFDIPGVVVEVLATEVRVEFGPLGTKLIKINDINLRPA